MQWKKIEVTASRISWCESSYIKWSPCMAAQDPPEGMSDPPEGMSDPPEEMSDLLLLVQSGS